MDVLDWLKQTIKNKKRNHLGKDDILPSSVNEKETLIREQRYLAEELKRITDQYIEKHTRISEALPELDPHDKESVERIKNLQEALWMACLRMETALKTMAQISREITEWERREHQGAINIQHPAMRLEILRSENKLRDMKKRGFSPPQSKTSASEVAETAIATKPENPPAQTQLPEQEAVVRLVRICQTEKATHLECEERRILERIHWLIKEFNANQESPEVDLSESLRLVRELKDEYGLLKRQDRKNRFRRHRAELANALMQIKN